MPIQKLKIIRQKYDHSRFWELFIPNTFTFQFWLASAAFSFFVYQTLYQKGGEGVWNIMINKILPWVFVIFAFCCMAIIFYLFISWAIGFVIKKVKYRQKQGGKRKNAEHIK